MNHHVVIGAGGIGQATARELVASGHRVTLVSRSGRASGIDGVEAIACDAQDRAALNRLARGAATIINAVNPKQYHHWDRDWPPIANAILGAAEDTGAGLVTVSNLYGYGKVDAPMRETDPLKPNGTKGAVRARMWTDALAAHDAGRVRVTELRASDYFGPGAAPGMSFLSDYCLAKAVAGKPVRLIMGVPDAPHSWTYLPDIGTLAATLATDDRSWGHAWHVPSSKAKSFVEVTQDVAAITGRPVSSVSELPRLVKTTLRVMPLIRSLDETAHQFERPFVLDSSRAESIFGLEATPWPTALRASLAELDHSLQPA